MDVYKVINVVIIEKDADIKGGIGVCVRKTGKKGDGVNR